MKLNPYLNFPGNCAEALRYYEQHLGAKIGLTMTHGQMPAAGPGLSPEWKDKILHASLDIAGARLMASDVPSAQPMRSAYLCVAADSDADAERMYRALADGGEVFIPLGETFFAFRFAQLRDRFGINWMVIHERPMTGGSNPG